MGDENFTIKDIVIGIRDDLKEHIEKTDKRLDGLEQWRAWIIGGLGIISLILPFVIYKVLQ